MHPHRLTIGRLASYLHIRTIWIHLQCYLHCCPLTCGPLHRIYQPSCSVISASYSIPTFTSPALAHSVYIYPAHSSWNIIETALALLACSEYVVGAANLRFGLEKTTPVNIQHSTLPQGKTFWVKSIFLTNIPQITMGVSNHFSN